jgi:hypothetical protein
MALVDPEVSRRKLERELELWRGNEAAYRERGWVLLRRDGVQLDVGFLARLGLAGVQVPVMTACIRLDYTDYDLQPPSVEFIDPFTGGYAPPPVPAVVPTPEGPRNLLVAGHPETGRPFFCVPGTREYHDHPQHSGDSWLLHRDAQAGSLATVCDRIWRSMARSLVGIQVQVLTLPPGAPQQVQLNVQLATGDVDALATGLVVEAGGE